MEGKKICERCKKAVVASGRSRYCAACKEIAQKEAQRRWMQQKIDWQKSTPQICLRCGREFFASTECDYCPDCRKEVRKERFSKKTEEKKKAREAAAKKERDILPAREVLIDDVTQASLIQPETKCTRREDGVLVLEYRGPDNRRRPPRAPGPGADALALDCFELEKLNWERRQRGEAALSYGQWRLLRSMK